MLHSKAISADRILLLGIALSGPSAMLLLARGASLVGRGQGGGAGLGDLLPIPTVRMVLAGVRLALWAGRTPSRGPHAPLVRLRLLREGSSCSGLKMRGIPQCQRHRHGVATSHGDNPVAMGF